MVLRALSGQNYTLTLRFAGVLVAQPEIADLQDRCDEIMGPLDPEQRVLGGLGFDANVSIIRLPGRATLTFEYQNCENPERASSPGKPMCEELRIWLWVGTSLCQFSTGEMADFANYLLGSTIFRFG